MRIQSGFLFSPKLPRHPLLRAILVVVGVVLVGTLLTLGLAIGVAVLAFGAAAMLLRKVLNRAPRRNTPPGVIEGEFEVVDPRTRQALPRARNG